MHFLIYSTEQFDVLVTGKPEWTVSQPVRLLKVELIIPKINLYGKISWEILLWVSFLVGRYNEKIKVHASDILSVLWKFQVISG